MSSSFGLGLSFFQTEPPDCAGQPPRSGGHSDLLSGVVLLAVVVVLALDCVGPWAVGKGGRGWRWVGGGGEGVEAGDGSLVPSSQRGAFASTTVAMMAVN